MRLHPLALCKAGNALADWLNNLLSQGGVTQKPASAVRSSKVEVGHSDLLEVDVNWKGTRENEGSVCSVEDSQKKRTTVMRENPLSLGITCFGQDMGEDDSKSLEEMSFVPSAVG